MAGVIVKIVVGFLLFAGSLVGGLAATGRLNHEGTANIPVLNLLFPAPPPAEGEGDGEGEGDAAGDAHGAAVSADHDGEAGVTDASHEAQDPERPRKVKTGRSVVNPDQPAAEGGGHGAEAGGHGAEEGGHGAEAGGHGETAGGHAPAPAGEHRPPRASGKTEHVEGDFQELERALQSQGQKGYEPGAFFRFEGMPAGLTAQQINEAWQRVQGVVQEVERRNTALDLRERELQELADDISRRQKELGEERLQLEQMQRQLDAKIQKFQETVKLVRNDEAALLKRNAETWASFETSKAAELVEALWATAEGQDQVLRQLEFMDKDAANAILAELPTAMVQDLLQKRLRVSKEPAPPGRR